MRTVQRLGLLLTATTLAAAQSRWRPRPEESLSMLIIPRTGAQVPLPTTDADVRRLLDYGDPLTTTIL